MLNCRSIDPLVTPFIDGDLPAADRQAIEAHLAACARCHARVDAERAVRDLIVQRRTTLCADRAPNRLRHRCVAAHFALQPSGGRALHRLQSVEGPYGRSKWARLAPMALAATLVVAVGAAFLYQFTARSSSLLAAQLTADHVKCFALNAVFGTRHAQAQVESSLVSTFGLPIRLPADPGSQGLELVGSRPCLYGEGRIAHVMYRHNGLPVSLFILPETVRAQELVEILGHEAAIWSVGDHTFVLIAREPKSDVERLASFVHASIH